MLRHFIVRRFRGADLGRILEIEHACFGPEAYDRNLFAEYHHKCGELFLVAVDPAAADSWGVCGYMITCARGGRRPDHAELVSVAVDPASRGRGAASALMESTLRRLRSRGIARLALAVKVTNEAAGAFYEKYGFAKVRRLPRYYEDGADAWLMARKC